MAKTSAAPPQRKKAMKRFIVELIIAAIILVSAVYLAVNLKDIVTNRILKIVELKPNSEGYETWLNPPTTITRGYHLFNITNSQEIVTSPSSATLQVKETRAYDYLLSASKKHVQWSDDNKALSYSIYRVFTRHETRFQQSAVNDTGVFVDLIRAIFRTQFGNKAANSFFDMGGMNVFARANAVEQLEGFTTQLFETVREKMTGPNTAKSGFVYRYNGSRSYNYTIRSGLMEKGQVLSFANENVPFTIDSPTTYPVTIYDGLTFVPMLFDKPVMHIFQADFCRPITVKFNKVLSMFGGIDVHEYVIKFIDFNDCTDPSNVSTCPELDRIDVSKCISASLPDNTIFLSKPHFYGSRNETMEQMNIQGFTPNRDQHEALIYFEPYSGTPLRAHHRIQLSIDALIDPMQQSEYGDDLQPTGRRAVRRTLPLLWIDQEVNVDDATIGKLRMVHIALNYGKVIIIVVAVALVLIIIGVMEFLARRAANNERMKRRDRKELGTLLK